ncbi:MAG: signal recognition particle-docking protein FtsY [Eubacteriales bacterium]|nr:signal recognition particle-docking protein FtsY [Eubacteriales bacterium]
MSFFDKLKNGLTKTKSVISERTNEVFKYFKKIDEELYEELEEVLIMSDVGVETSSKIIEKLREKVKEEHLTESDELDGAIAEIVSEMMEEEPLEDTDGKLLVISVIGVNGVGKTTTIGKLASYYKSQGKKVMLAAADTFRAAAIDQLAVWAERCDVPIVKQQEGSDPAAVVFDALSSAKARGIDVVLCDTAGRLHNKKNLMDELRKIQSVIDRETPDAIHETFLVLDSTTGQNALSQAKLFGEVADITGIVLTKLDGTAKGGIVIAIKSEQNIPVRFVGVGEQIDDLLPFDPKDFVKALFDK